MSTFILRDIDPELWRAVKSRAAAEGISLKALILELLYAWVSPP